MGRVSVPMVLFGIALFVLVTKKKAAAQPPAGTADSTAQEQLVTKDGNLLDAGERLLNTVSQIVKDFGGSDGTDDDGYEDFELVGDDDSGDEGGGGDDVPGEVDF